MVYFPNCPKILVKKSNFFPALNFLQVNKNQYHALVLLPLFFLCLLKFICVWSRGYFHDRTAEFWTTAILNTPSPLIINNESIILTNILVHNFDILFIKYPLDH